MKCVLSFLVFVFLLSACAPALTPLPPSRSTPVGLPKSTGEGESPTPAHTPAPTETPTPAETPALSIAQTLKDSADELSTFAQVEQKTVTVGGVEQTGLVGTRPDGSARILALEINDRRTRVGEWEDEAGRKFYVYVNPDYDPLHRILATEKTPRALLDFFFERLANGQFKSRAGGSADAMKGIVFDPANNGKFSFDVLVAAPEIDDWAVRWLRAAACAV